MSLNLRKKTSFAVGARGSKLSLAQTRQALALLGARFPGTSYRLVTVSTPGDRDLTTPIERSAPDFFTRDLDDAVRAGRIDFAVHSAKDLPDPMPEDLDWFWLSPRADPRDAWVVRADDDPRACGPGGGRGVRIGVSSARRLAYARTVFPKASFPPIRGSIDARLEQLRERKFDAVLMAMAGLDRLGAEADLRGLRIVPIPVTELEPPEAQGYLALTFRRGNAVLQEMRRAFVRAVRFVSAGTGDAGYLTVKGAEDIEDADVVLYDELLGGDYAGKKFIPVGKRCGAHSMTQADITRRLCDEARKGRRVVRLKGGDAGLFGRLAEEVAALTDLDIPFAVRPGVSALTVATTGTGLLLTRRGVSRGFRVETPRSTGTETPYVAFMAAKAVRETAAALVAEGMPAATPCALVLDAGGAREEILCGTLAKPPRLKRGETRPGLFVAGSVAAAPLWPPAPRVLVTCSAAMVRDAVRAFEDRGWRPCVRPLLRLVPREVPHVRNYDAVVLTSPAAVRLFFEGVCEDRRDVPRIWTCGAGTDAAVRAYGCRSDVMPESDFSAAGLIARIRRTDLSGQRVLRLRSAKAGTAVAKALRASGARCDDVVLYDNERIVTGEPLPPCEAVFFASASAVASFVAQFGAAALSRKRLFVMGEPTRRALPPACRTRAESVGAQILEAAKGR